MDAFKTAPYSLNPNDPDLSLTGLGKAELALQHHREAAEAFPESLQRSPEDALIWLRYGEVLLLLEHLEDAYDAFRKSADLRAGPGEGLALPGGYPDPASPDERGDRGL